MAGTLVVDGRRLPTALQNRYCNLHSHYTLTEPFRGFSLLSASAVFNSIPVPNHVLGASGLNVVVKGNGTNQLDLAASFPYEILRNLEEMGQDVPNGVPAPQGFLEPFHFHLEYVVPEPATPALVLPGLGLVYRSRRRRRQI